MTKAVLILGAICVLLVGVLYGGLVLSFLWLWFLVPLGVHPIGIAHAIGVSLLVSSFTHQLQRGDAGNDFGEAIVKGLVVQTLLLVLGFILHVFA